MARLSGQPFRSGAYALLVAAAFLLASAGHAQPSNFPPRELAVLTPPEVEGVYPAGSSNMGMPLPPEGLTGLLVHVEDPGGGETGADPGEACEPITNADELDGNVAFVRRGACALCLKVEAIDSQTDAVAVVIYNDERVPDDDSTVINYPVQGCLLGPIPSLFISRATGLLLLDALATDPVTVRLQPATPTDAEDGGEGAPERTVVSLEAYPNPASGPVTLALTLPEASDVRVEVFDVLGRRVALVHDGPLSARGHRLALDAARWPAGLYVVRASAGAASVARRLIVH